MKILLFGDFSNVHIFLKQSLEKKGHQVYVVGSRGRTNNQGLDLDLDFFIRSNSRISFVRKIFNFSKRLSIMIDFLWNLEKFDVVQFISPKLFINPILSIFVFLRIKSKSEKIYYYACSDDSLYWKAFRDGAFEKFGYSTHTGALYDKYNGGNFTDYEKYLEISFQNYFLSNIDGVIVGGFDYLIPYQFYGIKNFGIINYPLHTSKLSINNNKKIFIYFGAQKGRYGMKGANYIIPAIKDIYEKYKDIVVVKITEDISYEEYLNNLNKSDIVIDQSNSFGPGMAGLTAMALGKVVLTGGIDDFKEHFMLDKYPFFNIEPDTEYIYNVLEKIILNWNEVYHYKSDAFFYIKNNHDPQLISDKFLKTWSQ